MRDHGSARAALVVVLWCVLVCGAAASARTADDWLEEWLRGLRVAVPNQFLNEGGLTVALTDVFCESFQIGAIRSETDAAAATASLTVNGAACECSGRWEVHSMSLSGSLKARVNDSDVSLTLALSPRDGSNATLPSTSEATACSARVRIASLDFSGSGAGVLKALVPLLKSSVESAAADAASSALGPMVAKQVTAAMQAGDAVVAPLLVPPKDLPDVVPGALLPPMEMKNAFDWRKEPTVAVARVAAAMGGDAAFAEAARFANLLADGNTTNSTLLSKWFTDETGRGNIMIRVPSAWLPGAHGGTPSIGISLGAFGVAELAVEAAGIAVSLPLKANSSTEVTSNETDVTDRSSIINRLSPDPDVSTAMRFGVSLPVHGVASVAATVAVRVRLANASVPVVERATARARVTSPGLATRFSVAADKRTFETLAFEQRGVPGCIAPIVRAANITAVKLTGSVSNVELIRQVDDETEDDEKVGESLVDDVYAVVADVVSLLTEVYGDAIFAVASAAAGGPGRDAMNARAAAALDKTREGTCASPRADAATSPGSGALRISNVAGFIAAVCLAGALFAAVWTERKFLLARFGIGEGDVDEGRRSDIRWRLARVKRTDAKAARAAEKKLAKARARAAADAANARDAAMRTSKAKAAKEDARRRALEAAGEPMPLSVVPEWEAYELEDALLEADRVEEEFDPSTYLSDEDLVGAEEFVFGPSDEDVDSGDDEDQAYAEMTSPAYSPHVPLWIRRALPLVIFGNVALFLSSNTAVGAEVLLSASAADQTGVVSATAPPIFEFTLANSVTDMWRAGVYPLSVLIAVLSGGWPYLKLFAIAIAWCTPEKFWVRLQIARATTLRVVDALGKWSLIDAFVMVLFRVAFRLQLRMHARDSNAWASFDVRVEPKWGFHAFVLATIVSLAVGHVARHCASSRGDENSVDFETRAKGRASEVDATFGDTAEEVDEESLETLLDAIATVDTPPRAAADAAGENHPGVSEMAPKKVSTWRLADADNGRGALASLFAFVFAVPSRGSRDENPGAARGVAVAATLSLVWAAVVFFIGASIPAIEFEFQGLAGAALGETYRVRHYSLFSLITGGAASTPEPMSTARLALCTFAVLAPLVHLMSVTVLWLAPATPRERSVLLAVAEGASAWASLDVFLVSAVAAVAQISRFAGFIVGNACDAIDAALVGLDDAVKASTSDSNEDPLGLKGQDVCFDVRAKTRGGCWVLIAAALFADLATRFVTNHARCAVETETRRRDDARVERLVDDQVDFVAPETASTTTPYYPDV